VARESACRRDGAHIEASQVHDLSRDQHNFWADDAFPKKYAGYFGMAAHLNTLSNFAGPPLIAFECVVHNVKHLDPKVGARMPAFGCRHGFHEFFCTGPSAGSPPQIKISA
jgi:hypothetical protein